MRRDRLGAVPVGIVGAGAVAVLGLATACLGTADAWHSAPALQNKTGPMRGERFDMIVRDDFFAGYAGDAKRLDKAMKTCEQALAKNPKNAQALVWHGGGLMFRSGQLFQRGDSKQGMALWQHGLQEMDDAVRLQPSNVAVLIPRAATLIPSARYVPDAATARGLWERAASDYEKTYAIQKAGFDRLAVHSRGEILFGLAETYARLGKDDKARAYLKRAAARCKGTPYEKEATGWLGRKDLTAHPPAHQCIGCHGT